MGYMGFGMRKEVYTRKSREAFSKLKEVYADRMGLPHSNIKTGSVQPGSREKHSYRPFNQTMVYKVIKRLIISGVALALLWEFVLQEPYDSYRQQEFEKHGFAELYQNDLKHFDETFSYLESQNDKIISMKYTPWSHKFDITLKHPDIDYTRGNSSYRNASFYGDWRGDRKQNTDSISHRSLYTFHPDHRGLMEFKENWVYQMDGIQHDQIPRSIKNYMSLSNRTLNHLIKASAYQADFYVHPGSITSHFTHPKFGYYRLVYSDEKPQAYTYENYGNTYQVKVGTLGDQVYWTKEVKSEQDDNFE